MERPISKMIACIGELLWDKLPTGARLGGATANFAVFSARLGNPVSLVSSIGNDTYGRDAQALLSQPHIDLSNLQTTVDHPTGTVEVRFSPENHPVYTITPAVAWDFIQWTQPLQDLAATATAVYFGTLSQRHGISRASLRRFVESTSADCVRICDVNLRMPFCSPEVLAWSLGHATIIKISDEELTTVFRLLRDSNPGAPGGISSPEHAARALLDCFPQCKLVAVTLGSNGCLIANREDSSTHPGFPIVPADTVGAGDAFTAGLVHAYLRGASLPAIAEVGNLCGSFVASQQGATPELPAFLTDRISTLLSGRSIKV